MVNSGTDTSPSWSWEYDLKDLPKAFGIGNVRVVIKPTTTAGNSTVVQENNYYPFGMRISSMCNTGNTDNEYKYNGKELQTDFDLNWYDYGARFYDPALGRWHSPDLLADNMPGITPYHYCYNNPIRYIDLFGLEGEEWDSSKDMFGRNRFDSFSGMYIPPMDRPGGAGAYGYGDQNYGHFEQKFSGVSTQTSGDLFSNDYTVTGTRHYKTVFVWDSPEERMYGNAQGQGGNGIDGDDIWVGATGTYLSTVGNVGHNAWWWQDAKGAYRSTKLLQVGSNGKYVQGVQGLRNSYAIAGKAASLTKIAGNTLGAVGVGISVYDMTQNGINVSNSMDAIMGATTFIPVVGWVISGTYFTASFITELSTGKSISEHAQGWVNTW